MFCWARQLGRADRVTALERLVAARVGDSSATARRFGAVVDGRLSPYELAPPATVLRWVVAAALRGDPTAIRPFGSAIADAAGARLELGRRRRLLASVERSSPPTPELRSPLRVVLSRAWIPSYRCG
jgi:hypothetical protein